MATATVSIPCDEASATLQIRFPFGMTLSATVPGVQIPVAFDVAKVLMGQAQTALAPFMGIFGLIGLGKAVVDVLKAIPDAITSLSPTKITDKLGAVAGKLDVLLAALPPTSIPIFLKDVTGVLLVYLQGTRTMLEQVLSASLVLDANQALADSLRVDPSAAVAVSLLDDIVASGRADLDGTICTAAHAGGAFDKLAGALNIAGSLANLPAIPTLGGLPTTAAEAHVSISQLDVAIAALTVIHSNLPG